MWTKVDPTIRWLRREIMWHLFRRLGAEYVVCAVLVFGALLGLGQPLLGAVPLSLGAAQVLVLARLTMGLTRNPVSFWDSRRSTDDPLRLIATQAAVETDAPSAQTSMLHQAGYGPIVTARATSADGEPLYDVYQRQDSTTTLALGRVGGTRVLTSRLRDGRLLVSTDLLVPPSSQLIVNVVVDASSELVGADDELDQFLPLLLSSHQRIIDGLRAKGVFVEPAHASVFVEMMNHEQTNFDEIGPFLTPFLSLRSRRNPFQLTLVLEPLRVLTRSHLERRHHPDRPETHTEVSTPKSRSGATHPAAMRADATAASQHAPTSERSPEPAAAG